MAAIAEYQALQLVVDHYFQRQQYAAVVKPLLDFLRFVEGFGLDIWCLLPVNLDDYALRLVTYLTCHPYCVVKKVLGVESHAFSERMLLVNLDAMDAVKSKYIDFRSAVGGFLRNQKPSVAILFQQIRIYCQCLRLLCLERLILDDYGLVFAYRVIYNAYKLRSTIVVNMFHVHGRWI